MPYFTVKYLRVYHFPHCEVDIYGTNLPLDVDSCQQGEIIVDAKNFGDAEAKVINAYTNTSWDVEVRTIQRTPEGVVPTVLK